METETATGKLAAALAKAQGEFTVVPKGKTAKVKMKSGGEYSYRYADFADVLRMALPILSKHEIAFTQPLRRVDGHLAVITRISHASGEFQESDGIIIPENLDPQAFGSCLSYWRRYDGCSLLGIAPDEDDDGKLATDGTKAPRTSRTTGSTKESTAQWTKESVPAGTISESQRRRLFAICKDISLNTDALKDHIFKVHGFVSSKDITKDKYDSIVHWLQGDAK